MNNSIPSRLEEWKRWRQTELDLNAAFGIRSGLISHAIVAMRAWIVTGSQARTSRIEKNTI